MLTALNPNSELFKEFRDGDDDTIVLADAAIDYYIGACPVLW